MRYATMREMDISNGEGIGVSLFVQGCHFHCEDCFNSELWDFNGGKEWNEEATQRFLNLIDKPHISRVSILGGEPLAPENIADVISLLYKIVDRFPDKKIWLYTGYTLEDIFTQKSLMIQKIAVSLVSVVVDGPYKKELRDPSLAWKGSSNQRVVDIPQTLHNKEVVLYGKERNRILCPHLSYCEYV